MPAKHGQATLFDAQTWSDTTPIASSGQRCAGKRWCTVSATGVTISATDTLDFKIQVAHEDVDASYVDLKIPPDITEVLALAQLTATGQEEGLSFPIAAKYMRVVGTAGGATITNVATVTAMFRD